MSVPMARPIVSPPTLNHLRFDDLPVPERSAAQFEEAIPQAGVELPHRP
jgi:hypothetical protein